MKAFYIPAGLLALILAFSLWTGHYVRQRTHHWIALLEHTDTAAMEENWSEAEARLRTVYDDWDSSQRFFHTIMNHSDLDEAESLFAGARAVCSQKDDADFHLMLAQLKEQMHLLAETQSVSIKNIL